LLAFHGVVLLLIGIFRKRRLPNAAKTSPLASTETVLQGPKSSRQPWAVLAFLSIIALVLRLWNLNSDLWFDEVTTLVEFVRPSLGEIITRYDSQNQHMFFSVLAHLSIGIFGESAWALRLPSVILGIASIWILFFFGRKVLGHREALLAAMLMAVSYHHIWFSQNARGYMGLLFFTILATWLWLEIQKESTWGRLACYVVAVTLGIWIHLTMVFVVAAHALVFASQLIYARFRGHQKESPRLPTRYQWHAIIALLLSGSVTLQLYALSLPEFLETSLHQGSTPSEWTKPLWAIAEGLRSLQVGFTGVVVVLATVVLVSIGWVSLYRRDRIAAILMVLPALLGGVTMMSMGHNLWPRFFFFSMGFALLILVNGAMAMPRVLFSLMRFLRPHSKIASRIGVAITCAMIIASGATVPRCFAHPKQDFTGAKAYVEQNRRPGDLAVAVGLAGIAYEKYFAPDWPVVRTHVELNTLGESHLPIWLIYTLPIHLKAYHPEIWELIDNDFKIVKVFPGTLGGGEVYVCRREPGNGISK
jgi:4-amino-4-deoxy-L-arabinose transferase-like glycosyltransferase